MQQSLATDLARAARQVLSLRDPLAFARGLRVDLDPWQADLLASDDPRVLLNVARQAGKSTMFATAALWTALRYPRTDTLLINPSERQSKELLRRAVGLLYGDEDHVDPERENMLALQFPNGSRIIALPAKQSTIRGYTIKLLIADEAAQILDELYHAVRPMLAVTGGRLLAGSTPYGKRGWFYEAWSGTEAWKRIKVRGSECPRIPAAFLAEEQRTNPLYLQEYEGEFLDAVRSAFRTEDIEAVQIAGLEQWDWALEVSA